MSLIRERSDSPTERTDSKRRSTEPSKEFTFLEDAPSPIDKLHTICQDVHSPINSLFPEYSVELLATEILKNSKSDEVFGLTLECVKHLLEFLGDRFTISDEYIDKFHKMARDVWANPHFAQCLGETIEQEGDAVNLIFFKANQDPPALRMTQMEADPSFKPCLRGITSATKETILRVFFSILFSHWTEKDELTELDKRMRKDFFGRRMHLIANCPKFDPERLNDVIEFFVHDIEEASQAKDMEPFRGWLVKKKGICQNVDAILEKAKTDILRHLDTFQKAMHPCVGKKVRIKITMINGEYTCCFLEPY